jgi:hypothetical protein
MMSQLIQPEWLSFADLVQGYNLGDCRTDRNPFFERNHFRSHFGQIRLLALKLQRNKSIEIAGDFCGKAAPDLVGLGKSPQPLDIE